MSGFEDIYRRMSMGVTKVVIPESGWQGDCFAWTYVGSAQFQIGTAATGGTTDLTRRYPAGLKLAWSDGGGTLKYGVVGSSVCTGGTTDIYLVPTPDYGFNGSAIINQAYSRVELPDAWPGWFSYLPAWTAVTTNPTIGNGALTGAFTMHGNEVKAVVKLTIGNTTTTGAGAWRLSLPVAAHTVTREVGPAQGVGSTTSYVGCTMIVSTTTFNITGYNTSGWGTTTPFTWADTNRLQAMITYEA